MCFPAGLCRGPGQRKIPNRKRLPETTRRLVLDPRHPSHRHHDRQRLLLSLRPFCLHLQKTRPAALANTPLPPVHQRKSRTIHPDPSAGLGLSTALPNFCPAHPSARQLPFLLQS
jgi:hypothetical protein